MGPFGDLYRACRHGRHRQHRRRCGRDCPRRSRRNFSGCSALLFSACVPNFSELPRNPFPGKERKWRICWRSMYYIKNGLSKMAFLAVLYALFSVWLYSFRNATQVNTIVSSIHSALHNLHIIDGTVDERANLIFGIFIAAFVAMVLLGGIQRIGQVSGKARSVYGNFICNPCNRRCYFAYQPRSCSVCHDLLKVHLPLRQPPAASSAACF